MSNALISLTTKLSESLGMGSDGSELIGTLKATAFKGPVSDAQMVALLVVANQYGLNPWTKEIYAFPDRQNGIVPVVGVDGWSRIINASEHFDGMEFEQTETECTCKIYRKDRSRPVSVTEYMAECKRDTKGPWESHPRRMLRHKAMIQCARIAFGFGGIYDHDEAERIADSDIPLSRTSGAQVAAAVRQEPDENTEHRQQLVNGLEDIAVTGGLSAYAREWAALDREKRSLVGASEHARLKDIASAADEKASEHE